MNAINKPTRRYRGRGRRKNPPAPQPPPPAPIDSAEEEEPLLTSNAPPQTIAAATPFAREGHEILNLIADLTRPDGQPPLLIPPESVGVHPWGIEARLMRRGTLNYLLRYIQKSTSSDTNLTIPSEAPPPGEEEEDDDAEADGDTEWETASSSAADLDGGGGEELPELPSQARVVFDPLSAAGLEVHTRSGQRVPIARGFEFFPFAHTGYRHSTVGQCLLEALREVRRSDLFRDSALPSAEEESSCMTENQRMYRKEQGLRKILAVFDQVVFNGLVRYMGTLGWSPHRKVRMKGMVQSYKIIDDNMLAYVTDARLLEKPSARSPGFAFTSQSLKFIGMAVNISPHPPSTALKRRPSRLDTVLKLRRVRRFRNLRLALPPSNKSWVKPKMTHTEFTRTLGGE